MAEQISLIDNPKPAPDQTPDPIPTTTTETTVISSTDPAIYIADAYYRSKERKIKKSQVSTNRASSLGHPCLRYLVLLRLHWAQEKLHDVVLQCIFDEGNHQEWALEKDLSEAGIRLIQSQVGLEWPEYKITGHIDGLIEWEGELLPVEIKSVNPHWWAKIDSFQDIFDHRSWIVRKWAVQVTLYLAMQKKERGLMILKNKSTGQIKVLNVQLNKKLAKETIKKALLINEHVEAGIIPEPIEWDNDVCGKCGFYPHLCQNDITLGEAEIMDNPGLEADLERWDELKPIAKEFKELDESIKGRVRRRVGFCGDFEIGGTEVHVKGNPNPKPTEDRTHWRTKIRRMTQK